MKAPTTKKYEYSTKTGLQLKACKSGRTRNHRTNRCEKMCPPGKNNRSGVCVQDTSRALLRTRSKRHAKTPTKRPNRAVKTPAKRPKPSDKKTWKEIIKSWKTGKHLPDINGSVFWETSAIKNGGNVAYKERTMSAASVLPITKRADSSPFREYLANKTSPVGFSNPTGSCTLVAPPDTGKNFSHLGSFYKNASKNEIRALWKKVAVEIEKKLKKRDTVYVSTHGMAVPWLHVRICNNPNHFSTGVLRG